MSIFEKKNEPENGAALPEQALSPEQLDAVAGGEHAGYYSPSLSIFTRENEHEEDEEERHKKAEAEKRLSGQPQLETLGVVVNLGPP